MTTLPYPWIARVKSGSLYAVGMSAPSSDKPPCSNFHIADAGHRGEARVSRTSRGEHLRDTAPGDDDRLDIQALQ